MKVDSSGDPGYVVSIANRTPGKVYVYSGAGWKVKGASVDDPVLRAVVESGQEVEEFMWFDHRTLGSSSVDALESVEGAILVENYDTGAIVGEYAFIA